jgi:hypothetical protein
MFVTIAPSSLPFKSRTFYQILYMRRFVFWKNLNVVVVVLNDYMVLVNIIDT